MNFALDNVSHSVAGPFVGFAIKLILNILIVGIGIKLAEPAPYDENDYLISNTDQVNAVQTEGHWEFPCPHIQTEQSEKSHPRPDISVSWKHNGDTLLNIKNGDIVLGDRAPPMTSTSRNSVNGLFMVRADFHRYSVYYDEIVGDFSLTVTSAREKDGGYWECIVETRKGRHKRIRDEAKADKFLEISGKDPVPDAQPFHEFPRHPISLDQEVPLEGHSDNIDSSEMDDVSHYDHDSKPVISQIPVKESYEKSFLASALDSAAGSVESGGQRLRASSDYGDGDYKNYAVQTIQVTPVYAQEGEIARKSATPLFFVLSLFNPASLVMIVFLLNWCYGYLLVACM